MKEFDWTGVPEELKESMLGTYHAVLKILEYAESVEGVDATLMELIGHGVSNAKEMVRKTEENIENGISIFQQKKQ